jgi:hypothetical protein
VVLDVEVEKIEHCLENGRSAPVTLFATGEISTFSHALVFSPVCLSCCTGAQHQGCEFRDGSDHGECGAFYRDKGLVHVDAHGVGGCEEGLVVVVSAGVRAAAEDGADGLCEESLWVACAEVEAYCLEDEAFEADDDFAWGFEELEGLWCQYWLFPSTSSP